MEGLTPAMQLRLDAWRKGSHRVQSTPYKSPGVFVSRRGDYGDDLRDYEQKEQDAWKRNNEIQGKK